MIIFIIRHPETEGNRKDITQGHSDFSLTKKGRETARLLGRLLTDKNIIKIFSSDLGRCMQTSKIVNQKLNVDIIYTQELREQDYGDFNGKPIDIIIKKFDLNNPTLVFPNGESFNQMKKRVLHFIYQLNQKKPVLIVTHEGCLRAIISEILNVDFTSEKCRTEANQIFILDISKRKIIKID